VFFVDKSNETISPLAKRQLATWLRKRFANSVPAELLKKISDDQIIAQYFRQAEEHKKRLSKTNQSDD
jgi:hypothetical protein